jgi:hypothetical protein
MKCILVVPTGCDSGGQPGDCLPLFPLLDRPFLQHVADHLAGRGVTAVQFVLDRHANVVEEFLGDGARWGGSYSYHLTRDPARPGRALRNLAAANGPVLIGHADRLPHLPTELPAGGRDLLLDADGEWTGWAVTTAARLRGLSDRATWPDVEHHLAGHGAARLGVPAVLKLGSLEDVPAAQEALLEKTFPVGTCTAREVTPGVWLSRGATVSPSAELTPPVFLGENSAVAAGASVGPNVVVGADCLLDSGCTVTYTTVLRTSYVGPRVGLVGVIVEGRRLTHPGRRTTARVDPHLLDSLAPPSVLSGLARVLGRATAGATFMFALPLLVVAVAWLAATRPGRLIWPRRFVRVPDAGPGSAERTGVVYTLARPRSDESDRGWIIPTTLSGLVLELLPGLAAVAVGQLRLVGLPPRSKAAWERLPADQYPILSGAPAGLVTEAALACEPGDPVDDVLLADVYQAHTSTPAADARRLARFVIRAVTAGRAVRHGPFPEQLDSQAEVDTAEVLALPPETAGTMS